MNHPFIIIVNDDTTETGCFVINYKTNTLMPLANLTRNIWYNEESRNKDAVSFRAFLNARAHPLDVEPEEWKQFKVKVIELGREQLKENRTVDAELNTDFNGFNEFPAVNKFIKAVISSYTLEDGIALLKTLHMTGQIQVLT
jgi:hypothetical protein